MKTAPLPYALFLVDGPRVWYFPLPHGVSLTIGRSSECDLVVRHRCMSRKHAVLHVGERLVIEDLGSANGTFVADRRVAPERIAVVELGEPIMLGTLKASIVEQRPSGARLPRAWFGPRERAERESSRPSAPDGF